jgi:hypothetical protein
VHSGGRNILVDIGFNATTTARRRRELLRCPIDSLVALSLRPAEIGADRRQKIIGTVARHPCVVDGVDLVVGQCVGR